MLLTGPFAMLSMPSFDFHLPPCTEAFLIHLSPLWQLPLWQLPLFPSVAQLPCVLLIETYSLACFVFVSYLHVTGATPPLTTTSQPTRTTRPIGMLFNDLLHFFKG